MSENGNSKYVDATDGRGVGTSRRLDTDEPSLEERRRDLDDLAVWMSGLEATDLPLDDAHSLCNGRAFAELLHEIDKSFFDERWLETMPKMRTTSHLAVKRSNIRKLWRKMSDYILNVMNRRICGARWEEIGDRVDGLDETDIPIAADLAMTVAFIALVGPNQEKYVHYSKMQTAKFPKEMTSVARMVGTVVEEMPDAIEPAFHETSELHDPQSDMRFSLPESSSINGNGLPERRRTSSNSDQVLAEAQLEIDALRAEKDSLQKEVDRLTKALESPPPHKSISSDTTNINILKKQNEELRVRRREAKKRISQLEAALEQFQSAVEKLTLENDNLTSTQKEFNLLKTHLDTAQSEVEEWRAKANQYQSDAELVKKREKEVKWLRGQVKSLTSRLEYHVQTATIDEDNKAGIVQLRAQIGTLTANNVELNVALESKKRIVEQLEIQLIQHKEKVKELEDRKDDLIAERNELENKLLFKESVTPRSLHDSMFEASNISFEPFSEKSKLPLEIETKRLAERIQELEALEPLKGEIITIKSQNRVLEEENLVVTKQKEELERQVAELNEKLTKNQQHASGDVVELKVQLENANVEIERMREAETKAETKLTVMAKLLELRTKERDNYEVFLVKSKGIIDELEEQARLIGENETKSLQVLKEIKEENERLRQEVEKLDTELNMTRQNLDQENRCRQELAKLASVKNNPIENRMLPESVTEKGSTVYRDFEWPAKIEKKFVLKAVFDDALSLSEKYRFSEDEVHFGALWSFIIFRKNDNIYLYLKCLVPGIQKYSLRCQRVFKLKAVNGLTSLEKVLSTHSDYEPAFGSSIKWDLFKKRFVIDGKCHVEAHLEINDVTGVYKKSYETFDETMQSFSDTVLVVQNKRFYVLKLFLASRSAYFRTLFEKNCSEGSEIVIDDVQSEDFHVFLGVLYGGVLDETTVEIALLLADRFGAEVVTCRCEDFLIKTSQKKLKKKLQMAVRYKLDNLTKICIDNI